MARGMRAPAEALRDWEESRPSGGALPAEKPCVIGFGENDWVARQVIEGELGEEVLCRGLIARVDAGPAGEQGENALGRDGLSAIGGEAAVAVAFGEAAAIG